MAQKSLLNALKTLFSSNVMVHVTRDGKTRVVDTGGVQSQSEAPEQRYARNGQSLARVGSQGASRRNHVLQQIEQGLSGHSPKDDRLMRYADYELMGEDSIIDAALDFYADESVMEDDHGDVLTIQAEDGEVKTLLRNLYYDVLNIEGNLRSWIRETCKYGDAFVLLYIDYDSDNRLGVFNCEIRSPYHMKRIEGKDPTKPFEISFEYDGPKGEQEFGYWEVGHFSIRDPGFAPYGKPVIEGARKVFKKLMLMEDASLIHRLVRAPDRRVFKVDMGNVPPAKEKQYMMNTVNELKRQPLVDEDTGEYNLEFNLMNMMDDLYIPVRGQNDLSSVDTMKGLSWSGTDDLEYFRKKLMSNLRVPNAFMGYEKEISGKATLAQESIKFGNAVSQIQKIFESELTKIGIIHLFCQGIRDERLTDFSLSLTNPSSFAEKQRIELLQKKFQVAKSITDSNLHSNHWVMKNIFNLSAEEIAREKILKVEDWKFENRKDSITRDGEDPVTEPTDLGSNADLDDFLNGLSSVMPSDADFQTTDGDVEHTYQGGSPMSPEAALQDSAIANTSSLLNEEAVIQEMPEDLLTELI